MVSNISTVCISPASRNSPSTSRADVELEVQPTRRLSFRHRDGRACPGLPAQRRQSAEGEEALSSGTACPTTAGWYGIEGGFDQQLRGRAGAKSVQVNNLGYRQTENIWSAVEPGQNVILTLDTENQQAAERRSGKFPWRSAMPPCVPSWSWMCESGDLLALTSSPSSDPNNFIKGFPPCRNLKRWHDEDLGLQKNRATAMSNIRPGSIFKTIRRPGCARGHGLDPEETFPR